MPLLTTSLIPPAADKVAPPVVSGAGGRVSTFPAGKIISIETLEFDEFNECTSGWSVQHHPLGAPCRSSVFLVMTPSLQVAITQHTSGYCSQGATPPGALTVVVPVADGRDMVHRGHTIHPLQLGFAHSGEGYECVCRSGIRFVVAAVAQDTAERYAADLWHGPSLHTHSLDRLEFVDAAHRACFLRACRGVLQTVNRQPGVLANPMTAALLEGGVIESLFLNTRASRSDTSESGRSHVARKAYGFLRERADEVPSIRHICAVTGASYSTVERGFLETYGMGPKALMTSLRLSRARHALLHPGRPTSVTDVALRWGFVEFGRFASQYRQRYGEAPSETLRKVRGEPLRALATR